ncbi:SEL1-like repeat protein [Veillonella montpellierensis]|uniref:SEL1-like repeat protein n=1 Tax=Veillonella montpellierensis TaxID=187328 RepID=UPI000400BB5C|nr:SEL1-like repeat protein [Veillonella montpellierensis]
MMMVKTNELLRKGEVLFLSYQLEEAYAIFSELAQEEEPRAMYFIGELYWQGFGLASVNHVMAYEWYKKGAKLGDPLCQLCTLLHMELDSKKDSKDEKIQEKISDLLPTLENMAKAGDAFAQYELASVYVGKSGITIHHHSSTHWMQLAASQGHYGAMSELVKSAYGDKRFDDAFVWCDKLAHMGRVHAMYSLSTLYKEGLGCDKSEQQAAIWLEKAATAGYAKAQVELAVYYEEQEDEDSTLFWYEKAAEQGVLSAQVEVAYAYMGTTVVAANHEKACYWANQAAKQGSRDGKFLLAQCYWEGLGVDMNHALADNLLTELANTQEADIVYSVARMYAKYGVEEKAQTYMIQAAELGSKEAKTIIATNYETK